MFHSFDDFESEFDQAARKGRYVKNSSAFTPDELQIGSIVYCSLNKLLHYKENEIARRMLVTGLWRSGSEIKKIEMCNFTTQLPRRTYPSDFPMQILNGIASFPKDVILSATNTYIIDNLKKYFPQASNTSLLNIPSDILPDILVRRVQSIMYNPGLVVYGTPDFTLKREGFFFPTIPFDAIRSDVFVPEVHANEFHAVSSELYHQDIVDELVDFSLAYNHYMRRQGVSSYSFPDFQDWPLDLPRAKFPKWEGCAPWENINSPYAPSV